jgi:hypothetical protein
MGTPEQETMADAQRRLAEDEAAGTFNDASTPVSGTEETPTPDESAGTVNTDTGGPPENIPYARFKEVNDQYREVKGFVPIAEAGYDPDSVGRLIAFEEAYREDPTGTIATVVESMDLPDATKQTLTTLLRNGEPAQSFEPAADDEPEEPPEWAKPIIEDHQSRMAADESAYYDGLLQKGIDHWKSLDKKDEITTPDRIILRQIRASVDDGSFQTVEELAEHARSELMGYREETLGSAITTRRTGPSSIPGSGVPRGEPVKFENIKEATKAAEAAIRRGELPPIQPD